MKKILLILSLIPILFIQGCYSYMDMNRLSFSTLLLYDKGEEHERVLYSESFAANRGSAQDDASAVRLLLSSAGATNTDAYFGMQNTANLPLSYAVTKALVFTKEVAEEGLGIFMDNLERNQKINNRLYLFLYDGDPSELLNLQMPDEQFLGIYLENIMIFQQDQPRILSVRLSDYLNQRLQGCGVALLPIIDVQREPIGDRIDIGGAAIFIEDKLVGEVAKDDVGVYNFLKHDLSDGDLSVPHPVYEDTLVSTLVLSTKSKHDITYNGHEATLIFDIIVDVALNDAQASLDVLDDKTRDALIKNIENHIIKRCEGFFEQYKEKDIDILDVQGNMERKYPNADLEDILQRANIQLNIEVELEDAQNISKTIHNEK